MNKLILMLLSLLLVGCSLIPQYRIFQKKVDPGMAEKPPAQIESERRGAAFIREKSTTPEPDPAAQLGEIHAVATALSSSLGEPKVPPTPADYPKVVAELRAGLRAEQAKTEAWKKFARKYANTPLENTGIDLIGPAGVLGLVGVVAACIACPTFGWVLLRLVPVLWGTLKRMTAAVETYAKEVPEQAAVLKRDYLARKMDTTDKALVANIKSGLNPDTLNTQPAPAK